MRRPSYFTTIVLLFSLLLNGTNMVMAENKRPAEARLAPADLISGAVQDEPVGSRTIASLPAPSTEESLAVAQSQSFTTLTAGGYHTCALSDSGGVKCWGVNIATYGGQLGDGTFISRGQPQDVSGLTSGVTALAAGFDHTCVVMANGQMKCWGYNLYGQLGDGTFANHNTPVDVTGSITGVATLAMGAYHSCAVTGSGGVKCWGNNGYGQLGDGTTISRTAPIDVTGLITGVTTVAAGGNHTCAITPTGGVQCWGYNAFGQLGDGTTLSRTTPVEVSGLISGVVSLAAGYSHTCALMGYGGVKCWGYNYAGQLGDGTTLSRNQPVEVSGLTSGVTAIAAGSNHTCAILTDGGMKCWGINSYGQLGDGTTTNRLVPVAVTGLTSGVSTLATGGSHTCALMTGGQIRCWGRNSDGQLGNGTSPVFLTPTDVLGLSSETALIDTRLAHTCTVMTNGGVKCWGLNGYGQLGDETTNDRGAPVAVTALPTGTLTVAPGWYHTCAVTSGGGAKCWGWNNAGQLGDGTTISRSTPVEVTGLISGVTALASGWSHTCALTTNGGVKCWGGNFYGQLGNGSTTGQLTPVDVISLTNGITAITAGYNHTCALTINGGVKCWGDNRNGQLGDGTVTGRLTPVDVSGLISGVVAIRAGYNHTCALTTEGGMKCWGWNNTGQLGDGTTLDRLTPENVSGLTSGVLAMAPGWSHTCAVVAGGSVKCWGENEYGQLGDGTVTNQIFPVDASGIISGTTDIVAGHDHTCAMTASAGVKCWGGDFDGQIGAGRLVWSATPIDVVFSPGPDLGLTKWGPASVAVGSPITYSLTVNNHGTVTATGVIVTDSLPLNVTFVAASPECSHNAGLVTCALGSLSPYSGTATVVVVVMTSAAGWVHNTAQVGANEVDIDPGDNSAGVDTNVVASGPTVQFDAAAYRVDEGVGTALVTVTLSAPAVMTTVVSYASLLTGTATAGADYTSVNGTLVFVAGQSTATFGVPILEDALGEPDETVLLVLSNPINVTLGSTTVTVLTIADNDGGVLPGPDLGLTKWGPGSVMVGSPITYSLTAINQGIVTATGVIVTDSLPLNVTFVAASPQCAHTTGIVTCALGTLSPYSGTAAVSIIVTASATGMITNTAQVAANETDINPSNNFAVANTNVVSSSPSVQFDASTYRVSEGAGTAIVTVTLSAPAITTMTMVSYASLLTGTATAGVDYTAVNGTVFFGIGQTAAIFTVPILEDALSESDETVLLALSNPVNATLGSPTAAVLTIVDNDGGGGPSVDLSLTKWAPSSVMVSSAISYSLMAINHGTMTATGVIVTDSLPLNVTFVGASPQCVNNAGVVGCALGTLSPYSGTAAVFIIAMASATGMITNTAQVSANETDINPGDNWAGVSTNVILPTADMSVTKWLQGMPLPGEQVQYQIYFRNNGFSTAEDVVITDTLPENVRYLSWYGYAYNPTYTDLVIPPTVVNNQLVWNLGPIAAGGYGYLYPAVQITDTANVSDTLTNLVRISTRTADTNPTNDFYTHTVALTPAIRDVYVSKSLNSAPGTVGGNIEYRIHVGNQGNATARDIVITDTLPADVIYVSDRNWSGFTALVTGTTVVWTRPALEANSSADLYLQVQIADTASSGEVLTNVVSARTTDTDLDLANNVYTNTTSVEAPSVDLAIDKYAYGDPRPGEEAEYALYYWNQGTTSASNVRLTDTLPAGTTYLWSNIVPTVVNGNTIVWTFSSILPYGYGYLSLRVRVTDTVSPGMNLVNIAQISGTGLDVNPGNNNVSYTTTVRSLPGHITGIVTAPDGVTPLANISVQAYRNVGGWWNVVGGGSTDLAGNYDIGDLEPGVYHVRFYDWSLAYPDEYYHDQPNLESAADISVTAGAITRYIDASLNEPAPPVAQATATTGIVHTDPKTGEVNIDMSRWNRGNITVTKEITCASGLTSTEVTLILSGTAGLTTYPMVLTGTTGSTYQATLPADQIASGDLTTQFICPGIPPATNPVGKIYLYDPSGKITDALTGDPIEGAQVDLLKVPDWQPKVNATDTTTNTCETNLTKGSADWDSLPPAPIELGIQVDPQSGEIDPERNPLFTNSQGRYGWNVAQGCWYIVVQKSGYTDRVSPLVGVPPEVTDLDLALTPTSKTDQAIAFDLLPDKPYGTPAFTLTATASSGLPVTFTTGNLVCTVEGNLVTLTGVGSCTITAHQAGNTTYNPAPDVSRTFFIAKANQTITFDTLADKVYGAPAFTLTATASSSLPVTFTTSSLACTVEGNLVTLTGVGSCTITAHQTGNTTYNAAPDVSRTFFIAKANQIITFDTLADKVYGAPTFTLTATASSGLPVTFTTSYLACTVEGNLVTLTTSGICAITAHQAGDGNYNAASDVTQTFTIARADTATALASVPTDSVFGQPIIFTAAVTSSVGIPTGVVTFTLDGALIIRSLNSGIATYTTNTLAVGSYLAVAVYGGDAQFDASQSAGVTVTVTSPVVPVDNLAVASNSPTALGHATAFTATIGAGSNVTYAWAFGDGASDTGALVSHIYPATGNYTAVVTAANSAGRVTKTVAVVVVNATTSVASTAPTLAVFPSSPGALLSVTLTVFIPAGAVASPVSLAYTILPSNTHAAPAKFTFAGANFSLEMYQGDLLQPDYQFSTPITLTLAYNPANLSVSENSLELRYWNGNAWVSDGLTLIQRDTAHHRLVITLTHLSEFALLGQVANKVYLPLVVR